MQNLWGASTGFRRKICITSDLWKHCRTSAAACRTSACGYSAEPLPAGPLFRTSAAPLQNLSGTSMEPMQNLYGFPPETLHNLGSVEAPLRQRVQNLCLRNLCRTSAAPLRNLSGTSTEPMQNLCGTSTDPRRICGSVYRTSACGTSAEPTSTEPFQSLCCTAECVRNLYGTCCQPFQHLHRNSAIAQPLNLEPQKGRTSAEPSRHLRNYWRIRTRYRICSPWNFVRHSYAT